MGPNSLTALAADELGDIRFASWQPGGPAWWQGWTHLLRGKTAPGGHVTAVSRRPGYLDVFTVGTDGRVWTAAYDPSNFWNCLLYTSTTCLRWAGERDSRAARRRGRAAG